MPVTSRSRRAAAVLIVFAGLARPEVAEACYVMRYPPWFDGAHLLAVALPDTVLAGRGSVPEGSAAGTPDARRPLYGQKVRLLRAGGHGVDALAPLLARGPAEAVLVPWDEDPSCKPYPWRQSVRWVEPGQKGSFRARLRDRAHWADGRPTFDVFLADDEPYPQRALVPPDEPSLGADEMFALGTLLPTFDHAVASTVDAYAPVFAWARANPTLALSYPAHDLVRAAVDAIDGNEVVLYRSPLAGTYRLTVSLAGQPDLTVLFRAGAVSAPWYRIPTPARTVDELLRPRSRGHSMDAEVTEPVSGWKEYARLNALEEPEAGPGGERVWKGYLDITWYAPNVPAIAALELATRPVRMSRRYDYAPAVIRMSRDGRVTVEQTIEKDGQVLSRIRGERISTDTR